MINIPSEHATISRKNIRLLSTILTKVCTCESSRRQEISVEAIEVKLEQIIGCY